MVVPKSYRPKRRPREYQERVSDSGRLQKFSKTSNMAAQAWWKTDSQRNRFFAREAWFYGIVDPYVAKTEDVPLDGTIFFDNTGQKDKATFMNKNVTIELS